LVVVACSSGRRPGAAPEPPGAEAGAPAEAAVAAPEPAGDEAAEPPELASPEPPLPWTEATAEDGRAEAPPRWPAAVRDGRVLLRVGLASDLPAFDLPCCEGRVTLAVEGGTLTLPAPLRIEPAAGSVEAAEHRVQVAALKDALQAESLAGRLAGRTGWPADVRFDAASGLYRVRVGRFRERPAADAARARLGQLGFGGAWVIEEGGALQDPALRVRAGERSFRVRSRWLAVEPAPGDGAVWIPAPDRRASPGGASPGRYRGRLLVFLNGRGALNLVNELPLEEYLRGVVPRELGPELYPRLEALKAQAVAARTYALRHLGEFAAEGFDLCAEPRCQVYGGIAAEHPLSDRAVAETEGEVLLHGDTPIEALYSATCGGHTEDGEVVFPWLRTPYLRGVPCPEGPPARLAGSLPGGTPFPGGLTRRLVPAPAGAAPAAAPGEGALRPPAVQGRLEALARAAGLPPTGDRLRSLESAEVRRYVRSAFDLVLEPRLLAPVEGRDRPPRQAPGGSEVGAGAVKALPAVLRDAVAEGPEELGPEEVEWLVLGLGRVLGLLEEEEVRFRALEGGVLTVAGGGAAAEDGIERLELPGDLGTFAREGGALVAAELALLPGDPVTLYRWRGRLAAVARDGAAAAPGPDAHPRRASRFRTWSRFRSDARLAALVGERFPGLGFRGLEIVERGVSGRVGTLRLLGTGGRSELVEGLAVRWTLDLPDTKFDARRVSEPGREPGWLFTGGGWGHGVGMCQIGAYALAGRGLGYREILEHYYTGVRLGRVVVR
ncbi:MAG TPA: SpoIID/LytB domain-containing protein, partial [Thermoanaerobaculia bacterium]